MIIIFSQLIGLFVIDVSVTGLDINQCESETVASPDNNINIGEEDETNQPLLGIKSFHNTHKCHNTSQVTHEVLENIFGHGLRHFLFKIFLSLLPNGAHQNIGIFLFNLAVSHQ